MNDTGKVVWVTGASSGLGKSLALELARQGNQVIASGRDADALAALATEHENLHPLRFDITDDRALEEAPARLSSLAGHLDQVILNAGVCEYLDFPNPDWDAARRVMEVNFFGSVKCMQIALPLLRRSREPRPHLVVIGSQVTAAPFPRAEAYGASKAALQYFCDSLRIDLAAENIDVSVVNPGFVDTPLTRRNDFDMPFLMDVDRAAELILRKLRARPRGFRFPFRLSLLLGLSSLLPGLWQKMMMPARQYPSADTGVDT